MNDSYQAIARRYRPKKFSEVIGQDPVVATLKNALRMDKVAHAYIFCGLRGTGKTTLARLFAKALNCQNRLEGVEPCNVCPSCLDIGSGKSLDVIEIDGASNRGIDDIREITDNIGYASAHGHYKVIIIDEVHMLTKEAFNALLKSLEEPPENVKFFLATTEPHKVLPTILSRCQRFDLGRIAAPTIKEKLKVIASDMGLTCDEASLDLIVERSEGSMRDAESLFDQLSSCFSEGLTSSEVAKSLGLVPESVLQKFDKAFHSADLSAAFILADEVFAAGKDPLLFLEQLAEHFREVLAIKLGQSATLLYKAPTGASQESADLYTEDQCLFAIDFLAKSLSSALKTSFKRLHLESSLLQILRLKNRISLSSIAKRLLDLEQKLSLQKAPESPALRADAVDLEHKVAVRKPVEALAVETEKTTLQPPAAKAEVKPAVESSPLIENKTPKPHYETLLRFAAVELEGTIKK